MGMEKEIMNCNKCKTELIWGGDHDCEDYGVGGDGIVSNLSCPKCDTFVLVYSGCTEDE